MHVAHERVMEQHKPTPQELERIDGIEAVRRLVERFSVEPCEQGWSGDR